MAKFTVIITKSVQKQLAKLPDNVVDKLEERMLQLEQNPKPDDCIKLKGRDAYRIRVGNYRIIYDIQENILIITIIKVGHRKEIYRFR